MIGTIETSYFNDCQTDWTYSTIAEKLSVLDVFCVEREVLSWQGFEL